jgi:hypothetical protein
MILDKLLPPADPKRLVPTEHLRPNGLKARLAARFNLFVVQSPGLMLRDKVLNSDGSVAYESDWVHNALTNDGQASMLNVYFRAGTVPPHYLAMLNMVGANVPTKTQTMTAPNWNESETPGSNGYSRPQLLSGNWSAPSLSGGDEQVTHAQQTFGPLTTTSHAVSHVAVVTVATGTSGAVILWVAGTYLAANNAAQSLAATQSYLVTLSDKLT